MISLLIISYLSLFVAVGISSLFLLMAGMFVILKLFKTPRQNFSYLTVNKRVLTNKSQITSADIRAIAGEDELSTQLDLARAYIDVGKKQLAQKMLNHILQQGNIMQQQAAKELISLLGNI